MNPDSYPVPLPERAVARGGERVGVPDRVVAGAQCPHVRRGARTAVEGGVVQVEQAVLLVQVEDLVRGHGPLGGGDGVERGRGHGRDVSGVEPVQAEPGGGAAGRPGGRAAVSQFARNSSMATLRDRVWEGPHARDPTALSGKPTTMLHP